MIAGYIPDVIMLTEMYIGYYGYYYPKEILGIYTYIGKRYRWSGSKIFWELCKKYPDLSFFDKKIFAHDGFMGFLFVEGCISGKDPIMDWIEIHNYYEYRVIRKGGVYAGKVKEVPAAT